MADQLPSLQDLAKTISSDIIGKLKLSSGDAITKSLLKELQNLSASNKLLGKIVETADKKETSTKKEASPLSSPDKAASYKLPDVLSSSIKSLFDKFAGPLPSQDKKNPASLTPRETKLPDILGSLKSSFLGFSKEASAPTEPKSELESVEKPKDVRIIGFDATAIDSLKLPEIFGKPLDQLAKTLTGFGKGIENSIGKIGDNKEGEGLLNKLLPKGSLTALTGATLVLGGLAALTAAFNTDGESKGTLELIGKGGLKGGLAMLAKTVFKKVGVGLLKKIPVIGSLISYGFAIQRFMNGDVVGGIVELISGTVGLIPGPVGIALSTGVDVVQAILDAKAGGSSAEASAKKVDILKDWAKILGEKVNKYIKYVPIIGPMYEAGKAFLDGNITEGIKQLIYISPPLQWIGMLLGEKKTTAMVKSGMQATGDILGGIWDWAQKKLIDFPVLGPLVKAFQHFGKQEWLQGLKQLVYINPGFELIGSLLGDKSTGKGAQAVAAVPINIVESIGKWVDEKFGDLPYIGPLIKSVGFLYKGQWKEGLELIPGGKAVYDFLVSKAPAVNEAVADAKGIFDGIKKWFNENIEDLPFIGSALRGIGLLKNGQWVEGFEELAYVVPGVRAIAAFFGRENAIKGEEKSAAAFSKFDWTPIKGWFTKHIATIPFVGNFIKAAELFKDNQWAEGLKLIPGGSLITSLFGDKPEKFNEAVGEGAGILSNLGKWFKDNIEDLPFIGSAIRGIKLLSKGQWVDGLEELAYAVPGIQVVAAFFGRQKAMDAQTRGAEALGKFDWSSITTFAQKYLSEAPIIGPLMKAAKLLSNGEWSEGLQQLALSVPLVDYVAALFGSKKASGAAKNAAAGTFNFIDGIKDFAEKHFSEAPIIGPLMKAAKLFKDGEWVEGLQQLALSVPLVDYVAALFGSKKASGAAREAASISKSLFSDLADWVYEKVLDFPIIGPLIKSIRELVNDPLGVLKGLAESVPVLKNILSFFDTKFEVKFPTLSFEMKNPFDGLNQAVSDKAKEWWDSTKSTLTNWKLPWNKDKEKPIEKPVESTSTPTPPEEPVAARRRNAATPTTKPAPKPGGVAGDAFIAPPINSQKGFSISSPEVGALWQLDKRDGIIAGPVANSKPQIASTNSFGKAELILERIAGNTASSNINISNLINGFNNLAKALERTLGESAKIPMVINTTSNQQSTKDFSSAQYANAGNNSITNFRMNTVEGPRFKPA